MLQETLSEVWSKLRRVNATDAAFVVPVPTKTIPSAAGEVAGTGTTQEVVVARGGGAVTQNYAQLMFYGTGADNTTFSARFYGWSRVGTRDNDPNKNLYVPTLIAEFTTITLSGAFPGFAGCPILNTEIFADTVTLNIGNPAKAIVTSPGSTTANIGVAVVDVDFTGYQDWEVRFQLGTATDMNALYRQY